RMLCALGGVHLEGHSRLRDPWGAAPRKPWRRHAMRGACRTKRLVVACLLPLASSLACCGKNEPAPATAAPLIRRLTEEQYRNTIADVFGDEIQVSGRFDRPDRVDGLLENGTVGTGMSPSAFERYDQLARSIAAQVVDPANRNILIPCRPADPKASDRACADAFYRHVGRFLYRRPLTD